MVTSAVRLSSTFSKDFFSETTGPISYKFHMQPQAKVERKFIYFVQVFDQDGSYAHNHTVKTLKKSSSEPLGGLP